jgi:rubrerythrin
MKMNQEQNQTLEAIKFAIQMELDGKEYYLQASEKSDNKVGKELFKWLAGEEDKHRRLFGEIFGAIRKQKAWPEVGIQPRKGAILDTVFAEEMKAAATSVEASSGDLESIAKAMEMENKTREYYQEHGQQAGYNADKKLYSALAAEEEGHYLALVDYREYLIDPAGYFRKAEHHSLDGG